MLQLSELDPPQYFGELALLGKRRTVHSASVVSTVPCDVLVIPRFMLQRLVEFPQLQELMRAHAEKFYLQGDAAVRAAICEQDRWTAYKDDLVKASLKRFDRPSLR